MADYLEDGVGAVVIHRWFEDGEGWAYHPWFTSHQAELVAVFKDELTKVREEMKISGMPSKIRREAMGGVLIGEQVHDANCANPKTADRNPTILRAAFLLQDPTEQQRADILRRLTQIQAEKSGPDDTLFVSARPPHPCKSKWIRWPAVIVCLTILALLVTFGWAQWSSPRQVEGNVQTANKRMSDLLRRWGNSSEKVPRDVWETGRNFLRFLSQEHHFSGHNDILGGEHPDARFFKRLPSKAAQPKNQNELRRGLENLLDLLDPAAARSPKTPRELETLVVEIEKHMDYAKWWKREGWRLRYCFEKAPDKTVSVFARQFVTGAIERWPEDTAAAEQMLKILRKWQVQAVAGEDAQRRPWLVFHCFFQVLSKRHFSDHDLRDDSFQVAFVYRLPKDPLSTDGIFKTEQDLVDQLRKLADRLEAQSSNLVSTLITNIAGQLDYSAWKKKKGPSFSEKEDGPPEVKQFVSKFNPE